MPRRSYNQYCSVARALDRVGDRWTLLLIRELMIGPRRYTDLLHGLPGIGTNHLADRLKRLRADGVIRQRELPPPAASTVYELTELGRGLEPVVVELARWGVALLDRPTADDAWRAEWTVVALRGRFDPKAARGIDDSYQFVVDGQPFWARIDRGELTTGLGELEAPTVKIVAERDPFLAVANGDLSVEEAVADKGYRVVGELAALERLARVFPVPDKGHHAA